MNNIEKECLFEGCDNTIDGRNMWDHQFEFIDGHTICTTRNPYSPIATSSFYNIFQESKKKLKFFPKLIVHNQLSFLLCAELLHILSIFEDIINQDPYVVSSDIAYGRKPIFDEHLYMKSN